MLNGCELMLLSVCHDSGKTFWMLNVSLEHITLYVKLGSFFFGLLLYLLWISSAVLFPDYSASWGFSAGLQSALLFAVSIAYILRRLSRCSLAPFPDCLWIQCTAERCERLLAVSLSVKIDHLCLPSVICFRAGAVAFTLQLQSCRSSGALWTSPAVAVPLLLEKHAPANGGFCPAPQPWLLLPSSTPAAPRRFQPRSRAGWKRTQQMIN